MLMVFAANRDSAHCSPLKYILNPNVYFEMAPLVMAMKSRGLEYDWILQRFVYLKHRKDLLYLIHPVKLICSNLLQLFVLSFMGKLPDV